MRALREIAGTGIEAKGKGLETIGGDAVKRLTQTNENLCGCAPLPRFLIFKSDWFVFLKIWLLSTLLLSRFRHSGKKPCKGII